MKKLLFSLLSLFAIGLVVATTGYLVSSFVITTDVYEPFVVEYAILGNGGNWNGQDTCADYTGEWFVGEDVDVGGLYAGEGRKVCVKIVNLGEGDVDYTLQGTVLANGNLEDCTDVFETTPVTGTASGSSETRDGVAVVVAGSAAPVDDCKVKVELLRG